MDARTGCTEKIHKDLPTAPPCTFVVFGAGGDLTHRLLVPALYNLAAAGLLDKRFAVLGFGHRRLSEQEFRQSLTQAMRAFAKTRAKDFEGGVFNESAWRWLCEQIFYCSGDFEDPEAYQRLAARLSEIERERGNGNVVFYLATAPRYFGIIIEALGAAGLVRETDRGWRRVVIEKPFGTDFASARALNQRILKVLSESQIYRIDHFLGKETVQNIMALRFANAIFEPLWNRHHIDHVQITAAETVGVEKRGSYYDETGALRDMVPNHMFQLLAMTAMEPPNSFDADAVRTEKARVIDAIHQLSLDEVVGDTVRGQYLAGAVLGKPVKAYRDEPDVSPNSSTETYAALKLTIDNWRWAGVPFYIRTGKAMKLRRTEIAIQFCRVPYALFRDTPVETLPPNLLVLHVQPEEGVSLRFEAKVPGPAVRLADVNMAFRYSDYFQNAPSTGYETLLYDCLIGDQTLFQRADNIEAGWRAVQPILDVWSQNRPPNLPGYEAGSWGPTEADELLARDGRHWRNAP